MPAEDDLFPPADFSDEIEAEQAEGTPAAAPEPTEEAPAPEAPAPEPQPEPATTVPLAALQSAREENRSLKQRLTAEMDAMKRQLAQLQAPQQQRPALDPMDEGFAQSLHQTVQQTVQQERLRSSRFFAEKEFGAELVAEAFEYFNQNPGQSTALLNEPSPFHAAVEFYKRQKVAQEIGGDPEAWRQRETERIRKELQAEMTAASVQPQQPARGPSLAGQPNLGARQSPAWSGPTPLDDILKG